MGKGHVHNNGGRGRSYGLLLLVAFGFAILGVMVLHKLRERRIVTLVVKDKDHQLITLQLLLQKEREYVKEAKSKMESMKAKMRTLRTQKMELDSRVLEMQSTISSLRDDQMAMEIALEEKRNELNQLRERSEESNLQTIQANAMSQMLRQKEAEIQELKHYHELPLNALNRTSNATHNVELHNSPGLITETAVDVDMKQNKSAYDGMSNEHAVSSSDGEMATREENSDHSSNEMKVKGSRNGKTDGNGMQDKKKRGLENGVISEKFESQSGGVEENEEHASKNQSGAEDDDYHGPKVQYVGGKKLEIPKNLHGGGYTFRGKHGHISRLKGKRWRLTANGKGISTNSMMDTPTTNEGLKMKISEQRESEKGKGDIKVRDNTADDDRENRGDSIPDTNYLGGSMAEHAEDIMTKAENAEEHHIVTTYTSLENSNSSYEESPRDMKRDHRDRGTYNNSSNHSEDQVSKQGKGTIKLDEKDKKSNDPKMKGAHEEETEADMQKQSEVESQEKGEE